MEIKYKEIFFIADLDIVIRRERKEGEKEKMKGRHKNMSYASRIAFIVIPNKIKMNVVVSLP